MKKTLLLMTAILCSMLFASCSATRTYAPYAFSTVSTVTLPALQHSLERKDYEILDTISRDAVVTVTSASVTLINKLRRIARIKE